MLVNVIDIGANTVKMSLFRLEGNAFSLVGKKSRLCRLISHCSEEGLSEEGTAILLETLRDYCSESRLQLAERTYAFATASLRRASNRDEVISRVKEETGLTVDLISEEREAQLSFKAVLGGTVEDKASSGATLDMGGGSTEIVLFDKGRVTFNVSLPFGCLSLYNAFVRGEIATEGECSAIGDEVKKQLIGHAVPTDGANTLYMAGGSARAVGLAYRNSLSIPCKDDNGFAMEKAAIDHVLNYYNEDKTDLLKSLVEDRYNLLRPAAAAFREIARHLGCESIVISSMGMREGYLYERIEKGDVN